MTRHRGRGAGRALLSALAVLTCLLTAGCSLDGRGSLPFARGTGGDGYRITVQMADVSNLVPNAEVKVNDVTVGSVTGIRAQRWRAVLTVDLARAVDLPANAIANVGQKSLLGAQYLEIAAPTQGKPVGRLVDGGVIPIERTGTYPGTEELLIALSSFLNGSGLTQLKTIVGQMNIALDGRTDDIRALLANMQMVMAELSSQRRTMAQLLDRMDQLSRDLAKESPKIRRSLPALGPGLKELDRQRPALMRALRSVDQLDTVATPVLAANAQDLTGEIRDLRPALKRVADAGDSTVDALNVAGTILYPLNKIPQFIKGDYMNLFINLDLRANSVKNSLFAPSAVESASTGTSNPPTFGELLNPSTRGAAK